MKIIRLERSSYALILVMLGIFLTGIWYADHYYERINTSEDPRVVRAKQLYQNYNQLAVEKKYHEIFELLDSVALIYAQFNDYKQSYELGVVHNNRAALWLNMALYDLAEGLERDSVVLLAKDETLLGINRYEEWMATFGSYGEEDFDRYLKSVYQKAFPQLDSETRSKYVQKRKQEMLMAQEEMSRRLSVSYTNLGVANRYFGDLEKAVHHYQMAMELWEENLTAENNINVLLGRPLKERSLLHRLFPPEK